LAFLAGDGDGAVVSGDFKGKLSLDFVEDKLSSKSIKTRFIFNVIQEVYQINKE
jgi:hypothetical protein